MCKQYGVQEGLETENERGNSVCVHLTEKQKHEAPWERSLQVVCSKDSLIEEQGAVLLCHTILGNSMTSEWER